MSAKYNIQKTKGTSIATNVRENRLLIATLDNKIIRQERTSVKYLSNMRREKPLTFSSETNQRTKETNRICLKDTSIQLELSPVGCTNYETTCVDIILVLLGKLLEIETEYLASLFVAFKVLQVEVTSK